MNLQTTSQTQKRKRKMWLTPLLLSPVTIVEILSFGLILSRYRICNIFIAIVCLVLIISYSLAAGGDSSQRMKAIWCVSNTYSWYNPQVAPGEGSIAGLVLHNEALKPRALVPGTAVIKVSAAGLNPVDYKVFMRLPFVPFLRYVLPASPSIDAAGIVEESKCDEFKKGDKVFGLALGSISEYALVLCSRVGKVPNGVSMAQAGGMTVGVASAFTMFGRGILKKGNNILIVGAGGGMGQIGILVAKILGASKVYCIVSKRTADIASKSGCDELLDYEDKSNFEKTVKSLYNKIDVIYDTVSSFLELDYYPTLYPVLKENGYYRGLGPGTLGDVTARLTGNVKPKFFTASADMWKDEYDLLYEHGEELKKIYVGLEVKFTASDVAKAYQALASRRQLGKIVVTMGS